MELKKSPSDLFKTDAPRLSVGFIFDLFASW